MVYPVCERVCEREREKQYKVVLGIVSIAYAASAWLYL